MLTLSNQSPSNAGRRRSSCRLNSWFMPTSQDGASSPNFTRWTWDITQCWIIHLRRKHTPTVNPPDIHCTNPAEWEICTWKNHFLSGISGLPKTFPIANSCHLTNQTDFTLNMLWPCHQNPALLVFKALEGSYSFDATPMAPLGTKVLAYHKPNQCSSWGFQILNMWYISPSLWHYWCIKIIMRDTGGECITDMFRYKYLAIPI